MLVFGAPYRALQYFSIFTNVSPRSKLGPDLYSSLSFAYRFVVDTRYSRLPSLQVKTQTVQYAISLSSPFISSSSAIQNYSSYIVPNRQNVPIVIDLGGSALVSLPALLYVSRTRGIQVRQQPYFINSYNALIYLLDQTLYSTIVILTAIVKALM